MSTSTPWHVRTARKHGQTAVLYAALALSAPGEYALARMAGWDESVAWLMPAVMSLYAAIGASVAKNQKETARQAAGTSVEAEARRRSRNASIGALLALLMATAAQVAEHILTTGATGTRAWVVIVVSAVPPLVAAHVLHIDPPMELPEPVEESPSAPAWALEEPVECEQEAAQEPSEELPEEVPTEAPKEPQEPLLVTYKEAGERLGVKTETVRGWVNRKRVAQYPGHTESTRRVDLKECIEYQSRQIVRA